jgi:hypothetical protein
MYEFEFCAKVTKKSDSESFMVFSKVYKNSKTNEYSCKYF